MRLFSRILMFFKMKSSSALNRVEDPRQVLDYAYGQQQELLLKTKRGLIEVATSKAQLEQQSRKLRARVPQVEEQARRALSAGREDIARIALQRKQTVLAELEQLDLQLGEVTEDERRLTQTGQQLSARIEEFRTRRDVIAARYTAAQAHVRATEAFSGVSGEFAELSMALGRAVEKTERMQARAAAIGDLVDAGALAFPGQGVDLVEQELRQVTAEQAVEEELAAMQEQLGPGEPPPALNSGA